MKEDVYESKIVGGIHIICLISFFIDSKSLLNVISCWVLQAHLGISNCAWNMTLLRCHIVPQHCLLHQIVTKSRITTNQPLNQRLQVRFHLLLPVTLHVQISHCKLRENITIIGSLNKTQNSKFLSLWFLHKSMDNIESR